MKWSGRGSKRRNLENVISKNRCEIVRCYKVAGVGVEKIEWDKVIQRCVIGDSRKQGLAYFRE